MSDPLLFLLNLYQQGDLSSIIRSILPSPEASYEEMSSEHPIFPFFINYIDAALFGTLQDTLVASHSFCQLLEQDKQLCLRYPKALLLAKQECKWLATSSETFSPEETKAPSLYLEWRKQRQALSEGWASLKQKKPAYAELMISSQKEIIPWYPLRYFSPPCPTLCPIWDQNLNALPILLLEPISGNFTSILDPLKERPALFLFETYASFFHMLQFPEVVESLQHPKHLLYILELYPHAQFATHPKIQWSTFLFQSLSPKVHFETTLFPFLQALKTCLTQPEEALKNDTPAGNELYKVSKQLVYFARQKRLGLSRAPALLESFVQTEWQDPHKGSSLSTTPSLIIPSDFMEIKLLQLAQKRKKRKLRLVHVVSQIIDGKHAPSRLLENLILHHNPDRFEVSIVSTELLQFNPWEYPYNFYNSKSSKERAPQRIAQFISLGVPVHIVESSLTYEKTAENVAALLQNLRTDSVIFHGPNAIHYMIAQLTDTPLRVLFEHGTPPTYSGFDLLIVSTHAAVEIYQKLFERLKVKVASLPFALDLRKEWQGNPLSKEQLGLPKDSLVMTTISNHLKTRLSPEMCLAIVEILKKIPHAYYAPMGSTQGLEKIKIFFQEQGVSNRIVFLNSVEIPSQYARSMHLYLNEFPFGSCLGILDAMAAGCPVVSMYNVQGPQQARYGGIYMGLDRAIHSGKREDYVKLACELLLNEKMYQEWSEHTKRQYEKHADVLNYVKTFENIILLSTGSLTTQ